MKSFSLLTGALSAVALCAAIPALAAVTPTPAAPPAGPSSAIRPDMPPPPPGFGPGMSGRMGPGHRGMRMRMGGRMRATPEERAKERADRFARMDANKDGKVTEGEFHSFIEARKREREHQMFQRFSGGQDAVTLDQLNARALERERAMQNRGGGRGFERRGGPGGPPPAPPAR